MMKPLLRCRIDLGQIRTRDPVQSLADLGNRFEVVRTRRAALMTRDALVHLAAATVIPRTPLLLTIMPLEELLKKLFGILF